MQHPKNLNMKIKILSLFSIFIFVSTVYSQTEAKNDLKLCAERVNYSVDDTQLKLKYGAEFLTPTINPKFVGGIQELKKYLSEKKLTDSKAKGIVFRTHIGFLVNCSGIAESFEVISNGKGDLKTLSEQVLDIVSRIPQTWESANIDGKQVDCYQILSFTIVDGDLTKVNYR